MRANLGTRGSSSLMSSSGDANAPSRGNAAAAIDRDADVSDIAIAIPNATLSRAKEEYRESGRRMNVLGSKLCAGPPWNMLLDLFISESASRPLSVTALCLGARTSSATALRYLSILQEAQLVRRTLDATDARRSYVGLTPLGWSKMRELLDQ